MKRCARCLYPESHPLNLVLDAEGVCSGCRIHEEKDLLDWTRRRERLIALVDQFRAPAGAYDCVVPVSGGRDSFFIVHTVKKVLGLNPLLVTYNRHHNTEAGIRNISYLRTLLDCDILTLTLKPELVKRIVRETLRLRGSMLWHVLAGQSVYPVRVAVGYKIPLIIWGAHQGLEQVGMFSHRDEVEMTRRYRHEHDLMRLEAEDLASDSVLTAEELAPLMYPRDEELAAVGVRGIYLGNFIRWDSKAQHEQMLRQYQYETVPQHGTFDPYEDADCVHYSGTHDYLKYLKCGYGKVTDHACREIRFGRMSREAALAAIQKFSPRRPPDLERFLSWVGLSEVEFDSLVEPHRLQSAWEQNNGQWRLAAHVEEVDPAKIEAARVKTQVSEPFYANSVANDRYQLLTTGMVDEKRRFGSSPDRAERA